MPRIANFRTYFCKKNLGEDPQTTSDPTFNTTFSFILFCNPLPLLPTFRRQATPLIYTNILQIWMIPHNYYITNKCITYYTNDTPYYYQTLYRYRPFTEFWVVSIEHLRRVWHADRGRLLLWTPVPVPLGLACVLLVETNPFSELVVIFPDYALRISLGTFRFCINLNL